MATAPSTTNYSLGRGTVTFNSASLGNCTQFRYAADIQKLDHYSSMAGVRVKDKSVVTQMGATISMVLDEITPENLALFILADGSTSGSMGGLTSTDLSGTLAFTGTNDVGNQVSFTGTVNFTPSGNIDLITENDWMNIPVSAEVEFANGAYGQWTVTEATA